MYYPNMRQYTHHGPAPAAGEQPSQNAPKQAAIKFLMRYGRKAGISLAVYLLSLLPYVGRFVLPAASFYTFNKQVGLQPAILIFGSSIFLPRRYLVQFLQSYFASRSLMRELVGSVILSGTHESNKRHSSSLTFHVSDSPLNRRRSGSTTAKVFSLDSALGSSSSSRFPCSVCSSTALPKLRLPS